MADKSLSKKMPKQDALVTRPDIPLPTVQDPEAPRGGQDDPKPAVKNDEKNSVGYTA